MAAISMPTHEDHILRILGVEADLSNSTNHETIRPSPFHWPSPALVRFRRMGILKLALGPEAPLRRATGKNNAITARSGMRKTEAPFRSKSNLYLLMSAGPGVGPI